MAKSAHITQTPASGQRQYLSGTAATLALPNLIKIQHDSFDWLLKEGVNEVLREISPIEDYSGKNFSLELGDVRFEEPKYSVDEAALKRQSYEAAMMCTAKLLDKTTGEVMEQEVYLGNLPLMTPHGTFMINGNERVVINQLTRSPGVFYSQVVDLATGRGLYTASLRPARGSWIEFETAKTDVLTLKIDRRRKMTATTLLRAFGVGSNDQIRELFADVDTDQDHRYIEATLEKDPTNNQNEAFIEIYSKMRPGDPAILENARSFFDSWFGQERRYSLGKVGRYKLNKRLGLSVDNTPENWLLSLEDLVAAMKELIVLNNTQGETDDVDHLANRRVRQDGELIQHYLRIGMLRLERLVRERLSVALADRKLSPSLLVNARPIVASLNEFFGSSQLSQFMDQTNPLAEVEHLRRLSVYGPGGLTRERAGFSVRDVHASYYGRICPIKVPEGSSVGLLSALATYARINEYGFIEAPYRKVEQKADGAYITDQVVYMDASDEEQFRIAEATVTTDSKGKVVDERVNVRFKREFTSEVSNKIDYVDATPSEMISISAALIPFISSDVGKFPLMGSNMENQAVPLIQPKTPLVGTGMEHSVVADAGRTILAEADGEVVKLDARTIEVAYTNGTHGVYRLEKFKRTNQDTCYNQRPSVEVGQKVKKGDVLIDGPSSDAGELSLGRDLLTAWMPWEGFTYENSVVINQRILEEDLLTSIHIEEYEAKVMDTKLGAEEITRDIPNVSEEALANLDESGIVYIGAEVSPGDILVGKIAPKGETELTAEERLLRAIFGEKAREVRDTSLVMPHGDRGTVIDIQILDKEQNDELDPGELAVIKIKVAQRRKISVGDKISGRHGEKGIVAKVLAPEDMPYLADGTPVDIILNPMSIIARMNVGQIIETHLGWAAEKLGVRFAVPAYEPGSSRAVIEQLGQADLPKTGKAVLYDGRTGEAFDQEVTVGQAHIMKLIHLVEDKVHARSTGPYSLITQQPLGGKAQMGGQRLGEMEVWALEAYGAANTLQEMLTIKSDDIVGRAKAFEAIVKGIDIPQARIPESFKVLVKELNSLGLAVDTIGEVVETNDVEVENEEADAGSEISRLTEESILNESVDELEADQAVQEEAEELAEAAGSEEDFAAASDEPVHVVEAADDQVATGEEA
jgi:DNA-directed RNA polymerase subunit beta